MYKNISSTSDKNWISWPMIQGTEWLFPMDRSLSSISKVLNCYHYKNQNKRKCGKFMYQRYSVSLPSHEMTFWIKDQDAINPWWAPLWPILINSFGVSINNSKIQKHSKLKIGEKMVFMKESTILGMKLQIDYRDTWLVVILLLGQFTF